MRIGELLVEGGTITPRQLEAALERQVALGGRLGSNLVEIGALDLDTLAGALSRQHHVPAATQAELEAVTPETAALVARPLAELHALIPLRVVKETLVAAFMHPPNASRLELLTFMLGHNVAPTVAPELRILYYLEKLYGLERKQRFLRVPGAERPALPTGVTERRRYATPFPAGDEDLVVPAPSSPATGPTLPANDAARALERATTRDEVGDALVAYLRSAFRCGLVFVCKDGMALGWKGFAPGVEPTVLEVIAAPLAAPSFLAGAYERHEAVVSAAPPEPGSIHARLCKALRSPAPAATIAAPVMVKDRVVSLVYAHADAPIGEAEARDLAAVCAAAGAAFVRLIQASKTR